MNETQAQQLLDTVFGFIRGLESGHPIVQAATTAIEAVVSANFKTIWGLFQGQSQQPQG